MSRNLHEFPITPAEVIGSIDSAIYKVREEIGGNDGFIMHVMKEYLIANPAALASIVNRCANWTKLPQPVVAKVRTQEDIDMLNPQLWNWA